VPEKGDETAKKWRSKLNPKVIKRLFNLGREIYEVQSSDRIDFNRIGHIAREGLDIINNDLGGLHLNELGDQLKHGFSGFFHR
jgi:hypothetical protein